MVDPHRDTNPPAGGWSYVFNGLFIAAIGGAILGFGVNASEAGAVFLGWAVLLVGGAVTGVGVVAAGVRVALRERDYENRRTRV